MDITCPRELDSADLNIIPSRDHTDNVQCNQLADQSLYGFENGIPISGVVPSRPQDDTEGHCNHNGSVISPASDLIVDSSPSAYIGL